jgi:hypothetical protein
MSAAATAAGYLYASGRLRGRGAREQDHGAGEEGKPRREKPQAERPVIKKPVRVAALPTEQSTGAEPPKRTPRIEYRVRRWRPGQEPSESSHGAEPSESE